MVSALSAGACHWRWFLVNNAKAFAPISTARNTAFSTPPEALTCAPIYFILCPIN